MNETDDADFRLCHCYSYFYCCCYIACFDYCSSFIEADTHHYLAETLSRIFFIDYNTGSCSDCCIVFCCCSYCCYFCSYNYLNVDCYFAIFGKAVVIVVVLFVATLDFGFVVDFGLNFVPESAHSEPASES